MVETHQIKAPDDVCVALAMPSLVPPAAGSSLGNGAVAELRRSMARFSDGEAHARRRSEVVDAIARIDPTRLGELTSGRTRVQLESNELDACRLGRIIPSEALALALGASEASVELIVSDVELIVRSIGRGETVDHHTEVACDRLMSQFADHPDGPVAAISLLYQVFDSTASLLAEWILAGTDGPRRSALDATIRVATESAIVGSANIRPGDLVRLSLDSPEVEFGYGRHQCPGSELARAIVAAICATLAELGFRLQTERVTYREGKRPDSLPMMRV